MNRAGQVTHVLLRIVAGFLFMQHGGQKLFGWYGGGGGAGAGLPPLIMAAGIIEFLGGLAVMLGLFTRPVAFLLSGQMAVAYFMVHFPKGLLPLQNKGETAALFSFIFFFFAGNGAGRFSLDAMLRGRASTTTRIPAPIDEAVEAWGRQVVGISGAHAVPVRSGVLAGGAGDEPSA